MSHGTVMKFEQNSKP